MRRDRPVEVDASSYGSYAVVSGSVKYLLPGALLRLMADGFCGFRCVLCLLLQVWYENFMLGAGNAVGSLEFGIGGCIGGTRVLLGPFPSYV